MAQIGRKSPQASVDAKRRYRIFKVFFSGAEEVELDKMDRIHIPQSLKISGNLSKDAVLVGIINRFEIWDRNLWDANFEGAKSNFESIAATMSQIGF